MKVYAVMQKECGLHLTPSRVLEVYTSLEKARERVDRLEDANIPHLDDLIEVELDPVEENE